jgi:ferredoxin
VVRVVIDDERCQGHGRCWSLEKDLFEPKDDFGHSAVIDGVDEFEDPDRVAAAWRAADACPERAITVVTD